MKEEYKAKKEISNGFGVAGFVFSLISCIVPLVVILAFIFGNNLPPNHIVLFSGPNGLHELFFVWLSLLVSASLGMTLSIIQSTRKPTKLATVGFNLSILAMFLLLIVIVFAVILLAIMGMGGA